MDNFRMPLIGEKAPEFTANSTAGPIHFPADYKGKWVVFFSHPGDFTPVCTTELLTFASMKDQFAAKNAELLGLSVDSNPSHIAWVKSMDSFDWKGKRTSINFPIIADDFGTVARTYGMLMPSSSATKTVRNVYMIDPEGIVRAIISYPLTTGRNMNEIYRLLLALQAYDQTGDPTPANWQPGEAQLYPVPATLSEAQKRTGNCLDWYICFTNAANNNNMPSQPTNLPMMSGNMPSEQKVIPKTENANANMGAGNQPLGMTMNYLPADNQTGNMQYIPNADNVKPDIKTDVQTVITFGNIMSGSTMGYVPNNMSAGYVQPNNVMNYMTNQMPMPVVSNEIPDMQSYVPEIQMQNIGNMPMNSNVSNAMPAGMPISVNPVNMKSLQPLKSMKGPASDAAYADILQPGRPFCPDYAIENEMPAIQKPITQPSIAEQNRNIIAQNTNQSAGSGNFLGDYIITRSTKKKK